jgi:hypothetical protein
MRRRDSQSTDVRDSQPGFVIAAAARRCIAPRLNLWRTCGEAPRRSSEVGGDADDRWTTTAANRSAARVYRGEAYMSRRLRRGEESEAEMAADLGRRSTVWAARRRQRFWGDRIRGEKKLAWKPRTVLVCLPATVTTEHAPNL